MQIDLRIPDDYCQGDAETLYSAEEEFWEEDKKTGFRIKSRNGLTQPQ